MEALEHKGFMPPEHLMVIDTMLTMPGAMLEAEYQRRINAINAVTAFCGVEEGRPTPRPAQSRRRPATSAFLANTWTRPGPLKELSSVIFVGWNLYTRAIF